MKLSQGGCEAIDVRKLVIGFQFGSAAGKFHIRRDDGNGQLCDFCQDVVSVAGPPVAPNSIENLTPVHGAKQQIAFTADSKLDEFLDFSRARAVVKKGQ